MLKINFLRRHYPYQVHGSKRNTLYLSRMIVQHPVAASADKYIELIHPFTRAASIKFFVLQ